MPSQKIMQTRLDKYLQKKGKCFIAVENIDRYSESDFAEVRHMWFGASDSAKLFDLHKYQTKADMLNEKEKEIVDETISEKPSVRAGKELEPLIIKKAEKWFQKSILKPVHMYGKHNGLAVNFDGVMWDRRKPVPVEIKFVSFFGGKNYDYNKATSEKDEVKDLKMFMPIYNTNKSKEEFFQYCAEQVGIPLYYYTQLQQQIDFLDAPHGYLTVLDNKNWRVHTFMVARNALMIEELNRISALEHHKLMVKKGLIDIEPEEDNGEEW